MAITIELLDWVAHGKPQSSSAQREVGVV